MNQRPAFAPLQLEVDDAKLETLAREKGVGTYDVPGRPELPQQTSAARAKPAVSESLAVSEEPDEQEPTATPREKMKKLNLELPDYAWTELKIRAAQQQVSMRHVVMLALVADGIAISEQDLVEDGRRLR